MIFGLEAMELLGYLAATLTTVSFIPQALKVYKTRNTQAISLSMFLVLNLGVICWAIYGIYLKNTPIVAANIITFVFSAYILFMKLTENRRGKDKVRALVQR